MTGPQPDEPVLVALLTTDPAPEPLVELASLDDRLGVVPLPADASADRLASVDPDCVVVAADALADGSSVVDAHDAELPVFVYRADAAESPPADASAVTDGAGSVGVPAPGDASAEGVAGVLTRSELVDAIESSAEADGADAADDPGASLDADAPVARIVSAVSDYWLPDDVKLRDVALDAVSVGVSITDPSKPDNPIVYVNEQFTRITGYAEHEILGHNCRFMQGPDTDPESVAEIRRAIDEERPTFVELRNYRQNGTPFRNELQILPVTDDGEVVNFLGLQRDVTEEHRRSETEARVAEARREVRAIAHDGSRSVTARLEDLLALGRETMDVANAHLVFIDPERDHHEVVRADGSAAFERGDTSPLSESYCRHSFGDANAAEPHGRGGVAPDANGFAFHDPDDPALDGDPAHERHGAGCYLSEPVYRDGELYGTVCFADARPREAFAEAERQFAVLLSTHVGRLLERVDGTGTPLRDD